MTKSSNWESTIKPILVLTLSSLVASLMLALVNSVTAPVIEANQGEQAVPETGPFQAPAAAAAAARGRSHADTPKSRWVCPWVRLLYALRARLA